VICWTFAKVALVGGGVGVGLSHDIGPSTPNDVGATPSHNITPIANNRSQ